MLLASPEHVLRAHAIETAIERAERTSRSAPREAESPRRRPRMLPVVSLCAGVAPASGPSCC